MTNKKVARPFNDAATPYTFHIPFNADLFKDGFSNLEKLTKALGMTIWYRADDDDGGYNVADRVLENSKSELGKGAILSLTQPGIYGVSIHGSGQFRLSGYASDRKGLETLDVLYDDCVKAIYAVGGKLQAPFEPNLERLHREASKPKTPRS